LIQLILIVLAVNFQAEYYTNTNFIYDMAGLGEMLYCATNGGITAFNTVTNDFTVLTNTDGLQKNTQNCVAVDSSEHIWAGNDLGLVLIENDLNTIHVYPVECLTCTRTTEIVCLRDSIYVGSSNGLLFIDTRGTPTDFNDDRQVKIFELPCYSIRSIAVDDTSVWVGTATGGIVQFSKDMVQIANYTSAHGLLSNEINDLMFIGSQLYAATNSGLNRFAVDHFDTLLTDYAISKISYLHDSIVLGLDQIQQVGLLQGGSVTLIREGLPWGGRVFCLLNLQGELLCGLGNQYMGTYYGDGIGRYDEPNNIWAIVKNRCIPSNHIDEITANEHGVFVACGERSSDSESRGLGWLNNERQWVNFSTDSMLPSNNVHRCTTDPRGRVWLGYNTFPDATSSVMLSCFDPRDSTWFSINNRYNGMEGTEAVWDLEFDDQRNMYLALGRPTDKMWIIDSALNTVYYLTPQTTEFRIEIALDSSGRIWQTHPAAGLSMTDTRNTLFDRNDDNYRNYTAADGLISNYMRGCMVDRNNTLYAAADEGLVIHDGTGFINRTDITESALLDVEIDSQGRIWILARDGVHYLDPSSGIISRWRFSDHNIDINFLESIGDITQVQSFEFDPIRHCFWVGGETGLLQLTVTYDSLPQIGAAIVYPNPVNQNTVRIKDIPMDARVDIYTISGRRVARDLIPDIAFPGEVVWHIPDNIGSGMYFALVRSEQGNHTYKFAIVR
jgi:hypothetical protein